MTDKRPTIAELERILAGPNDKPITILPNGEIRVFDQPDTVYAHVERTVHALLDAMTTALPGAISPGDDPVSPHGIKLLAEAVQALSSWPQFNPMNAHKDYQQLAEYEVGKAFRAYRAGAPLPACSCGIGIKFPEPWHADGCSGRSYQR